MKPPRKPRPKRDESALQTSLVRAMRVALPFGWIVAHVANKPRSAIQGAKEKRMGAIKGFPDLIVIGPREVYFLEVKAKGGSTSPEQRDVHDRLEDLGFPVDTVRSLDDVQLVAARKNWPWRMSA